MARETINGISVPIPDTGEPPDFVSDLRRIATDLPASIASVINPTETAFRTLDMRGADPVNIGYAGDSTGSPYSTGAAEKAYRESLAAIWPERPARVLRWLKNSAELDAADVWEDGAIVTDPGGIDESVLIGAAGLSGSGEEIIGQSPDVGSNVWAGQVGAWVADSGELVPNPSYTGGGIPMAMFPVKARANKKVQLSGEWRISTVEASNKQRRLIANADSAATYNNSIRLSITGSTVAACTLVKAVGGTLTTLATFPAGTIPSSAAPAWYDFTLEVDGENISATLNGQTVTATLAGGDDAAMGAYVGIADNSTASGLRAIEALGDVTRPPVEGGPSPYGMFTLYNANYAGGEAQQQLDHLSDMFPAPLDVLHIHHGHNYDTQTAESMIASFEALIDALAAQQAGHPFAVVVESENPQFEPSSTVSLHAERQTALRAWAIARGFDYVPIFEAFSAEPDGGKSLINAADGIHPIVSLGADFQKTVLKRWISNQTRRPPA